jgi:hypothetical protein
MGRYTAWFFRVILCQNLHIGEGGGGGAFIKSLIPVSQAANYR